MNLEKYKSQMAQQVPNKAFVEETLDNLKNNCAKLRIPVKEIGKAVGGVALLTAAAFTVLVGVGAMHGTLFENSITEQVPEEENAILADREALYMTPLSNPNHTVRIDTENGKVAMNENTSAEEVVDCGGVIESDFGFVGYERICNFFRAYRNGEAAELVIAQLPTDDEPDKRSYQYIGLNEDGTVNGKYYLHKGEYLSTFPFERGGTNTFYGIKFGYCAATSAAAQWEEARTTVAGMAIDLSSYGRGEWGGVNDFISICTISDLLRVSNLDGDTVRGNYFSVLSNLGEKQGVNILWNGQYSTPSQLLNFLNITKTGMFPYCSTTVTDLTKTDEYEECFYALEYLDGKYRIFTMKNGFEGEFDTALFDGYSIEEGMIVFDNGSVEYRFPYPYEGAVYTYLSESNTAEMCSSGDSLMGGRNWFIREGDHTWRGSNFSKYGYFTLYYEGGSDEGITRFEPLSADPDDVEKFFADPRNCMKISEEYSEGELLAVEILYKDVVTLPWSDVTETSIAVPPPEKTGKIELFGNTNISFYEDDCEIREMPDGKSYLMITEEQWRKFTIKANTLDAENQRIQLIAYYISPALGWK